MRRLSLLLLTIVLSVPLLTSLVAQENEDASSSWLTNKPLPKWIWNRKTSNDQQLFFRRSFEIKGEIKSAKVYSTCDNRLTLWLNGEKAGTSPDWPLPVEGDVKKLLKPGKNQIAAHCRNAGGAAGFVFKLLVETADGKKSRNHLRSNLENVGRETVRRLVSGNI